MNSAFTRSGAARYAQHEPCICGHAKTDHRGATHIGGCEKCERCRRYKRASSAFNAAQLAPLIEIQNAPVIIERHWPLPHLRDEHAPKGYTYCAICRGFQHRARHDNTWHARSENTYDATKDGGLSRAELLATYAKPPL